MTDLTFEDHGTIVLLRTVRDLGYDWTVEHVASEPWQWLGRRAIGIEPRYVPEIVDGAERDGLTIHFA